jgi:hypothetical protein
MTPAQAKHVTNLIVNLSFLALIAAGLIFWFLNINSSPGSQSSYTFPRSVTSHEYSQMDGGIERITLKLGGPSGSDLLAASFDISNIAKHEVDEGHSEKTVLFHVVGDINNLYGNTIQVNEFYLRFSMDDLRQVNWTNIDGPRLLNLGSITSETGNGEELIIDYCAENQKSSELFCDVGTHPN